MISLEKRRAFFVDIDPEHDDEELVELAEFVDYLDEGDLRELQNGLRSS